ncbi:hypothetical protein [Polaromonas sp. C04]|uniref:hypothetical protein n=1 Tax=Polaromonas sp. C04 TaxID=1945857 RepID=UPI000985A192|nr:hypothetical protein [Polaromonas sp. C04]
MPDLVIGSSVGAINGAYCAGAPNAAGIAQLEALWRGLHRSTVFPIAWRSMWGFGASGPAVAVELGARRVTVLPTGLACALDTPPRGAIANALHAVALLIAHQLASEFEPYHAAAEIIMVPPLCPLTASPYDFSHAGATHGACLSLVENTSCPNLVLPPSRTAPPSATRLPTSASKSCA